MLPRFRLSDGLLGREDATASIVERLLLNDSCVEHQPQYPEQTFDSSISCDVSRAETAIYASAETSNAVRGDIDELKSLE